MDTIFTDSQFRKFMDRHRAESGMIRQPLIIQTSALAIELPALCRAQGILAYNHQRAIFCLESYTSRLRPLMDIHNIILVHAGGKIVQHSGPGGPPCYTKISPPRAGALGEI